MTTARLLSSLAATLVLIAPAVWADTGRAQGHASADAEQAACYTAKLAALQNAPDGAQIVNGNCACAPNSHGRIDCNAVITWKTGK